MANGDIPAGWYPEPSGAGGERWWDGYQWTQHVRGGAAAAEPAAQAQQGPASQVPAGWYPDPSGGSGQRYWDGAQWTEHVEPATGAASVAAGGGDASAQQGSASQVPAGWYPDPSGGGGQRYWDGAQWTEHVEPPATARGPASSEEARGDGSGAELAGDGSTSVTEAGAEGEPAAGVEGEPAAGAVAAQAASDAGDVHASTAAATSSPEIPAGWYPDPAGGSGQRWWDGTRWTDRVQDGSSGGEVGGGAADAATSAGSADESAGATTDAADSDAGAQRTEAVDLDPAEVDEPADPTEQDEPGDPTESDNGVSADEALGVAPSKETGDGTEADGPADDAGIAALGGAGALGAAGAVGASGVGEDATSEDPFPDGEVAADGDVADGGDTPLDGVDAVDEPRDEVGYEDAELTQPLATEDVSQAATEDVSQAATEDVGQAATEDAAATPAVIPPGWYADPSGVGERWWSGDAWTEHVRSTGPSGVTGGDQTSTGPMDQAQETQVMGATGHEAGQPGGSPSDQGGFTMTGVGDLPPTGPPPEGDDDDGGGGSGKLILAIVLIVVLLAAIGAGLWFFTDVFDAEGEPATAVAEENEELPEEQPEAEEPEPEPTFGHVRDVDYAEAEWSTTCVGSEGNGGSRPAQPQSITFGSAAGDSLVHPNPHDASGLPAFEVELGTVQYGDVTGDGVDEAVFLTYCDDATATDTGFAVWSLDEEGHPLQQPSPPIELTVGAFELDSFEVGDGRLVVATQEVQPDGSTLEVVTAYVFTGGSWSADEIEREEPPAAVEDDRIPGIDHLEFSDEWSFEVRVTEQAPLIATHDELPSTFIIALDESLVGFAGPDLDFDDLVDEWVEVLEAVADEEEVTLEDDWFTEVDIDGAERAVMLLYEGETAEINYYALVVEVGDLVVEVSVQMGHQGWLEEDQLRDDAIELFGSFTFDADALMEAYGQG